MRKNFIIILFIVPIFIFLGLYFFQEKLIFKPTKLAENYKFQFDEKFEEINILVDKTVTLNGVFFRSEAKKGIVLSFHGNKGNLSEIGKRSSLFTENGYDVLYMNYRGYGKSSGSIKSEGQLLKDAQIVYDSLKKDYEESQIILFGISIGSGVAAYLAANNTPHSLILTAPYSSFKKVLKEKLPFVPGFLWKYELNTNKRLQKVNCPISIFHGKEDLVFSFKHAQTLKENHTQIHLFGFEKYGHTNFLESNIFKKRITVEINRNSVQK
jgi:predicted alpha/beta-fold hydrolase